MQVLPESPPERTATDRIFTASQGFASTKNCTRASAAESPPERRLAGFSPQAEKELRASQGLNTCKCYLAPPDGTIQPTGRIFTASQQNGRRLRASCEHINSGFRLAHLFPRGTCKIVSCLPACLPAWLLSPKGTAKGSACVQAGKTTHYILQLACIYRNCVRPSEQASGK